MDGRRAFGTQLKRWRQVRGVSQLHLAAEAQTSPRHLSFIETGRSKPSRAMVLRLSEALEVPLRERNDLFLAAGLAPEYPERSLSDATMAPFRTIVDHLLAQHEPYPAFVIDRWWRLVAANRAASRLLPRPQAGESLVEVFFGEAYRHLLDNWEEVAQAGYRRLRREAAESPEDEELWRLLRWAEGQIEGVPPSSDPEGRALIVTPRIRVGDSVIETVSTLMSFSTAREVTLDELRIELVFPADEAARAFFQAAADSNS